MLDNNVIIFQDDGLELEVNIAPDEDTVWLTQAQMAELFQTTAQNITMHLKNIYNDELEERSTCKDFLQVRQEGKRVVRRKQKSYNLDVIISVGYRVNSKRGIAFRKWATNVLKQYIWPQRACWGNAYLPKPDCKRLAGQRRQAADGY